jgi:hypothetical protein
VPKGHGYPSCPGEACSRIKENKYDLKKGGDFTVAFGHGHPLVLYIITNVVCVSHNVPEFGIAIQNGFGRLKHQFSTAFPNLKVGALKQQFSTASPDLKVGGMKDFLF